MKCSECKLDKFEDQFGWRNKKRGKRHPCCKDCHNTKYGVRGYHKTPKRKAQIAGRSKRVRVIARQWKKLYLKAHSCVDCGEDRYYVLDFDHIKKKIDKNHMITKMVTHGVPIERLENEAAKCEIRCANCHRARHHFKRQKE